MLYVDTLGFWLPHVREAVEVFGTDRVMFGTDYGPVADRSQGAHRHCERTCDFSGRQKRRFLWRNAKRFFELPVVA